MSETIFYVVAENSQVKHVSSNVEQTGVHEHGSEQCREISAGVGKEAVWNECPLCYESVAATELHNKEEYI